MGVDGKYPDVARAEWYTNGNLKTLLVVTKEFETYREEDELNGRNIEIEQAEAGGSVFLLKFIGSVAAGGYGMVDHEGALAIDLRSGTPDAPASVGCVKNDFAGQEHEDERARFSSCSQAADHTLP